MIRFKLILKSMLSMPALREAQTHSIITFCAFAYMGMLFLVLKTFQYNKDKSEN